MILLPLNDVGVLLSLHAMDDVHVAMIQEL
jgi:hypothetical protein